MARKGPLITLLTGLAAAAVLYTLSANAATKEDEAQRTAAGQGTIVTPTVAPSATPSTGIGSASPAPSTAPAVVKASYAGHLKGGGGSLAIAVNNGRAIAYVCDGRRIEAWLQGTAVNGVLALTGTHEARLTGSYAKGGATGTVWIGTRKWTFDLPTVTKPSGLWRATATVRNARVVSGWIVLSNGEQVGVSVVDGEPQAAPPLDPSDGSTSLNGDPLTATAVDASAPL